MTRPLGVDGVQVVYFNFMLQGGMLGYAVN
jgi:hypothetical protein